MADEKEMLEATVKAAGNVFKRNRFLQTVDDEVKRLEREMEGHSTEREKGETEPSE